MRGTQGALILASTLQIVLGFSGLWRNITRFMSPLSAVPLVALSRFGLYEFGFPLVAKCVEIGLPQIVFLLIFSQYIPHLMKGKSHIFDRCSVLFSIVIVWFLKTLDKSENNKYKISLRSHHVSALLDLCKVGPTRRVVAGAYGRRCEANLPILEKLVQLRHKSARLLGYTNYADLATDRRMAMSSSKVFEFLEEISASLNDLATRELTLLKDTKKKEEGDIPFGIDTTQLSCRTDRAGIIAGAPWGILGILTNRMADFKILQKPGMVTTDLLMSGANTKQAKFFINVLAEPADEFVVVQGNKMKELVLADCTRLTDRAIKAIAESRLGLCAIYLTNVCKLTDASLGHLANGCETIQKMKFSRNTFSDEVVAAYLEARGGPLTELSLKHVDKVAHHTAFSLSKHAMKLHSLDLSWCREMTNESLGLIVDSW